MLGQAEVGDLGPPSRSAGRCPGFRSRWTMPAWWASCIARARVSTIAAARVPAAACSRCDSEGAAFDELQGEERTAIVLADVVDLHDIGMMQAGNRFGFGTKRASTSRPVPRLA